MRDLMFVTLMSSRTGPFFRSLIDMARAMSTSDGKRFPPGLVRAMRSSVDHPRSP